MNLLFDTNVVIDFLGRKEPFFDSAKRIIAAEGVTFDEAIFDGGE